MIIKNKVGEFLLDKEPKNIYKKRTVSFFTSKGTKYGKINIPNELLLQLNITEDSKHIDIKEFDGFFVVQKSDSNIDYEIKTVFELQEDVNLAMKKISILEMEIEKLKQK